MELVQSPCAPPSPHAQLQDCRHLELQCLQIHIITLTFCGTHTTQLTEQAARTHQGKFVDGIHVPGLDMYFNTAENGHDRRVTNKR